MNRYRIYDGIDAREMHIGYDSFASAERAAKKMNRGLPMRRYHVIDTKGAFPAQPEKGKEGGTNA